MVDAWMYIVYRVNIDRNNPARLAPEDSEANAKSRADIYQTVRDWLVLVLVRVCPSDSFRLRSSELLLCSPSWLNVRPSQARLVLVRVCPSWLVLVLDARHGQK